MADAKTPIKKRNNSLPLIVVAVIIAAIVAGALWYLFVREATPLQPVAQEGSPLPTAEDVAPIALIEGVDPVDEPKIPVAEVVIADTARDDRIVPSLTPDLLTPSGATVVHGDVDTAPAYDDEEDELVYEEDEGAEELAPVPQVSSATDVATTVPTGPVTPLALLALSGIFLGGTGLLRVTRLVQSQ